MPAQPGAPTMSTPWYQDPAFWGNLGGQLISAGASYYGGKVSRRAQQQAVDQQAALQREFAQMGVRWRVADAKAAGLHPLYALSAQVPTYSPVATVDPMGPALAEAGQSIGRAVASVSSAYERQLQALQLELLKSQIDETDARTGLINSQAARAVQEEMHMAPMPDVPEFSNAQLGQTLLPEGEQIIGQHISQAPTSYIPAEGDDSVGANRNPLWSRFMIGKGTEMVLPGGITGDAAEALESLAESPVLMWMTYMENRQRYGPQFTSWLWKRYFGKAAQAEMSRMWNAVFGNGGVMSGVGFPGIKEAMQAGKRFGVKARKFLTR